MQVEAHNRVTPPVVWSWIVLTVAMMTIYSFVALLVIDLSPIVRSFAIRHGLGTVVMVVFSLSCSFLVAASLLAYWATNYRRPHPTR